jgi:hypothetical protein
MVAQPFQTAPLQAVTLTLLVAPTGQLSGDSQ